MKLLRQIVSSIFNALAQGIAYVSRWCEWLAVKIAPHTGG